MADRKQRATQTEALRAIINEARLVCEHPNSTAAIAQMMLTKPFLRRLVREGCRMQLLAAGLNVEIRRYLKGSDDPDEDDATARQLEFWPKRHRTIVEDIDRARVYVPSRREFVPLEPSALTPDEAKEAGEYLIAKGENCTRIGRRLVALAEMGWLVASPAIQAEHPVRKEKEAAPPSV
jgi:hypothetical protein